MLDGRGDDVQLGKHRHQMLVIGKKHCESSYPLVIVAMRLFTHQTGSSQIMIYGIKLMLKKMDK